VQNSGAVALITNEQGLAKIAEIRGSMPSLKFVISVDGAADGALDFKAELAKASSAFTPEPTTPDTPAMMIYTSGTTGHPKGALHGHRVLPGHLPGMEMPHDFFPQAGDRFWTPADWPGPAACSMCCCRRCITALRWSRAIRQVRSGRRLCADGEARHTQCVHSADRLAHAARGENPRGRQVTLRTLGSGGESLGAETYEWGKDAFGLIINEFYGQTECNLVLASCALIGVSRPARSASRCPARGRGHR
jgi:acetyl-CoA synthetase